MYHFFVEKEQVGEQLVTITGPDVNHIKNVLRMKPGEVIGVSAVSYTHLNTTRWKSVTTPCQYHVE